MQRITRIMTHDNVLHETLKDAERHLDRAYADKLARIGHAIVSLDWKYRATIEYVDSHLEDFVQLAAIRKDMLTLPDAE